METVDQLVSDGDQDVVEWLVAIADGETGLAELAYLGAGPVENLLRLHGSQFAPDIEQAAQANERLRGALRFDRDVAPEIADRLRRFGEPL